MKERYGKSVLEAKKDVTCNLENYANPPIPEGYKHICGEWNNGFVIERDFDGSQFVWIPVGSLKANGTLDGFSFTEKFGRRFFKNAINHPDYCYKENFFGENFHETLDGELALQVESVKKYGGFYISRYTISRNKKTEKPQSVKGEKPWTNVIKDFSEFDYLLEVASLMESSDTIRSHLVFGAEYDSVLEWFLESKARTIEEITKDSSNWGNHFNADNSPLKIVETGSREEWCTNNIYDFDGNVSKWTQEQGKDGSRVVRGGCVDDRGYNIPVDARNTLTKKNSFGEYEDYSFIVALYIK